MKQKEPDRIKIGNISTLIKTVSEEDTWGLSIFDAGDELIEVDESYTGDLSSETLSHSGHIASSMIDESLKSLAGTENIHVLQKAQFLAPLKIGDTVRIISEIMSIREKGNHVAIETTMINQKGHLVLIARTEAVMEGGFKAFMKARFPRLDLDISS